MATSASERTPLVKAGVLLGRWTVMGFLALTSLSWFAALLTQDPAVYAMAIYISIPTVILFFGGGALSYGVSSYLD